MPAIESGLISVIMPCYNAAPYLEEAVGSALGQGYPRVEVVVVDDGSADGSVALLERLAAEHPGRLTLLQQDHKGPYPARNLAIRHARGEYVAFLDADDYWRKDCLERLHDALERNGADLAYCGWQNFGPAARNPEPYVPPAYEDGDASAEFLRTCPWPIHAALVRREVLEAVNGFSERCFSSMDYDLWLRILAHTRAMVRVPEVMAFYRWHGRQISTGAWKQAMDAYQVRRDFAAAHPERIAHLPPARRWELVEGSLLTIAYRAYWERDLYTAQKIFRRALVRGAWRPRDLKYLLPGLLPPPLFRRLVEAIDRRRAEAAP